MGTVGHSTLNINKQIRVPDSVLEKFNIHNDEIKKGVIFIFKESKEGVVICVQSL